MTTAEDRIAAITEAVILWRDRPNGDIGLAIALAAILDTEQPEPPASAAVIRAHALADRWERYGTPDLKRYAGILRDTLTTPTP